MKRFAILSLVFALGAMSFLWAADPKPTENEWPSDPRLGKPTTLDSYFPFTPPKSKAEWEARRQAVREQILVANGLWPLPEKTPLKPVIHGKIERDGYTIEKVFFASYPGHYVCGNLYRPKGKTGKLPAILNPHGHWRDGRMNDSTEKVAEEEIKNKAETTINGGRYPAQAIPAMLARMGCVVFHYDMVGAADSFPIKHTEGFKDTEAELRLQSFMGLQTWNSLRALDFLTNLPDVDPKRIGVTGHSGGGTQTFILCAIDDRPAVAFPAVMVGTAMQGGCVCENCSYLRQGTGNVEFAALFAPKPLGMTGAHDWTVDIEKKGLPELKALYKLYDAEDRVMAKCFPQFEHNYNQVSREVMYNWFNKHLKLGLKEPVVEVPFEPVPPRQLSVFDDEHPQPKDALSAEALRKKLTEASDNKLEAIRPKDAESLKEFRRTVGTAARVMVHDRLPGPDDIDSKIVTEPSEKTLNFTTELMLRRKATGEQFPANLIDFGESTSIIVCVSPAGAKGLGAEEGMLSLTLSDKIIRNKTAFLLVDVFRTGDSSDDKGPNVNKDYAGYTFGYNSPLLANRVHDILTAVQFAKGMKGVKKVYLAGFGKAGPWVLMARALCGDAVERTVIDMDAFRFEKVTKTTDEMMLPGALKYGGLPAFAALCAPHDMYLTNHQGTGIGRWVKPAYEAAKASDHLKLDPEKVAPDKMMEWLLAGVEKKK